MNLIIVGIIIFIVLIILLIISRKNNKIEYVVFPKNIISENKIENNKIPKIIHKTFKSNFVSKSMYEALMSWKNLNPQYDLILYDNEDCEDFIYDNFDERVLNAYKKLIPGAYKADLFRFCILYIRGGVYSDVGQECLDTLDKLIEKQDEFITAKDLFIGGLQINFICSIPKHQFLKLAIDKIVENVENNYYGNSDLDVTGPLMFGKIVNKALGKKEMDQFKIGGDHKFKILNFENNCVFNKNIKVQKKYKNYDNEKYELTKIPTYGILWNKMKIFGELNKNIHLINSKSFEIQEKHYNYDIKLWTLPKLKSFVKKYYSNYYDTIFKPEINPALKLLLVYHYGGIYTEDYNINFDKIKYDKVRIYSIKNEISNKIISAGKRNQYIFKMFKKMIDEGEFSFDKMRNDKNIEIVYL
jgi:mannosyltransferase OCH1-like enzyme